MNHDATTDTVLTDDVNALVFGAFRVIKKIGRCGRCKRGALQPACSSFNQAVGCGGESPPLTQNDINTREKQVGPLINGLLTILWQLHYWLQVDWMNEREQTFTTSQRGGE
ncbi:hypothetical protein AZE42_01844 [Rhizopogon vesiculosus]|uniref:Uncharacterized protein n=1 Tax=Rhizopogon vesiculosus TaxID=180088 RepID=A0A1J8PNU4_9AGAM|nr:hypothetical protein AZE42_01844 [Rhizopogon vesiculosus]